MSFSTQKHVFFTYAIRPILGILLGLIFQANLSAVTIYTDRINWEAAVTEITTDPFDNPITGGASTTLDSGIVSTQIGNTVRPGSNNVSGIYNWFEAEIGNSLGLVTSIQWDFPTEVIAFGADFNAFTHHGIQGNFDGLNTTTYALPQNLDFFGIVGDASFSSITFLETDGNLGSTLTLDNASFATAVPEPATNALLLALGVSLFIVFRRR